MPQQAIFLFFLSKKVEYADPRWFQVDPDPAFYSNADPDPESQTNVDPLDPDPG
jgi:hypothetical protein